MPFSNIREADKQKLIEILKGHIYRFKEGEDILPTIILKNIICIMQEGSATITINTYDGDEILVEELYNNSIFGSNISDIDNKDCQIIAKSDCKVLVFETANILNYEGNNVCYNTFTTNLFRLLWEKSKIILYRIRILTRKTIRDRLLEYFKIEYEKNHSKTIKLNISLKDLADYISVNRSSMFREIKYLKEDKIIEVNDKTIKLLYDFK